MQVSGIRIRNARIDKGLTQKDLADLMQFTVRAVSRWETGRANPLPSTWTLLAQKLDRPIGWLRASDITEGSNGTGRHDH